MAIEWTISGTIQPPMRHLYGYQLRPSPAGTEVTTYDDWSEIEPRYGQASVFPAIPEAAPKATLGIRARTVQRC